MLHHRFRDMIVRAVHDPDPKMLDSIAMHLAACERANEILRAKGYGASGLQIDSTAAQVPHARDFT